MLQLDCYFIVLMHCRIPAQSTAVERTDDDDDLPPPYSVRPEICPPSCRKSKLYRSPDVFNEFDKRAIKV